MLIYIFLAIYISIGTVNVYAASGNSPENFITNMGDDKGHESQQLGNCEEDYKMGTINVPVLKIEPKVVTSTQEWTQKDFKKYDISL